MLGFLLRLDMKTDPPIPMISARIVSDARGPFANTRLANVGKEKGVKPGYPVMSEMLIDARTPMFFMYSM